MARCGCSPGVCPCQIVDGDGTVVEGNGTAARPYQINATGGNVTVADTPSIDTTLTGDGSVGDPYVISSDVILTPDGTGPLAGSPDGAENLLKLDPATGLYVSCEDVQDCVGAAVAALSDALVYDDTGNAIIVNISDDPGNQVAYGTDGGLFAPAGDGSETVVTPADTPTVDMIVTGTGTAADPYVVSANACAPAVVANNLDETCVNVTVTGGTGCADPFVISAAPVIDPDPCNDLECRPGGLFVQSRAVQSGRISSCSDSPGAPGTVALPTTGRVNILPEQTVTITNNGCTPMIYTMMIDFPQTIMSFTNGDARAIGMASEDLASVPVQDFVSQRAYGAPTPRDFFENMASNRVGETTLAPGQTITFAIRLDVETNGIDPGGTAVACQVLSIVGTPT